MDQGDEVASLPRRVVVVGDSCSGKSTLAARLASALGAQFVELDALYWRPQWTPAPEEEFRGALAEVAAGERWVTAGNYTARAQVTTWPRAELVVWLDLPLAVVVPRLLRRTWRRWRTRELLWGTNVEDPWQHLRLWEMDKNLFSFTVVHHRRRRANYLHAMLDRRWADAQVVRLCSPAEIETFATGFEERARAEAAGRSEA